MRAATSTGPDLPQFLAGPQPWMPQGSELGRNSFEVFTNPLDSAFNLFQVSAGSGFGSLGSSYAFGGADNLFGGAAVQGSPIGGGTPFYAGYYSQGTSPWSVFGYFSHSGNGTETASTTTFDNVLTTTVGPAGATTTYAWVQQQTDVTNQTRPLASVNNDFVQTLVGVGPVTTGIGVMVNVVDNFLPAGNGTTVVTVNYDTTPGAVPTQTLDYTQTTVSTDARGGGPGSSFDIAVGVPLLLKTGGLSHFATLGFEAKGGDKSHTQVVTYSSPKNPASVLPGSNYTNGNTAVVNKTSEYIIPVGYALYLPPLIAANKKNQFIVTADANVDLSGAQFSSVITSALFLYPGGGNPSTASTAQDDEHSQTFAMGANLKFGAGAVHSLYFTPAPGVEYGIVPALYMDYARLTSGASLTTDTVIAKRDNNANGVYTDTNDTTTATVTTYGNAVSDTTGISTTNQFEAFVSMPMVLKIMPQGWIFGFTLGTTPQAWYQFQQLAVASRTKSVTTTVETVGSPTTTSTTAFAASVPSTSNSNIWTFQAIHTLALSFVFDKVTMDVSLNFKTVAAAGGAGVAISNIFDFNNLTIQAAVPLG